MHKRYFPNFRPILFMVALGGATAVAHAHCALNFATPTVSFGRVFNGTLAASETPGYLQLGSKRTVLLNLVCDTDRSALQVRIDNLTALPDQLLKWDGGSSSAAMKLRVVKVTADAVQVNLSMDDRPPAAAVEIVKNGTVLTLDLAPVHGKAKQYLFELEMTGLLANAFVPKSVVNFSMSPRVELMNP